MHFTEIPIYFIVLWLTLLAYLFILNPRKNSKALQCFETNHYKFCLLRPQTVRYVAEKKSLSFFQDFISIGKTFFLLYFLKNLLLEVLKKSHKSLGDLLVVITRMIKFCLYHDCPFIWCWVPIGIDPRYWLKLYMWKQIITSDRDNISALGYW